jgi:hypothetical protein
MLQVLCGRGALGEHLERGKASWSVCHCGSAPKVEFPKRNAWRFGLVIRIAALRCYAMLDTASVNANWPIEQAPTSVANIRDLVAKIIATDSFPICNGSQLWKTTSYSGMAKLYSVVGVIGRVDFEG